MSTQDDFSDLPLMELFRSEAEGQVQVLNDGLLALDRNAADLSAIEPLMRAAHSLKGAARIVDLEVIERLAHGMEDCFVAAQKQRLTLNDNRIDRLLAGVDLISRIASLSETEAPIWLETNKLDIANVLAAVYDAADPDKLGTPQREGVPFSQAPNEAGAVVAGSSPSEAAAAAQPSFASSSARPSTTVPDFVPAPSALAALAHAVASGDPVADNGTPRDEQVLKVNVRNFDRLLSLASESRVASHALQPQLHALQRFKQQQHDAFTAFARLGELLATAGLDEALKAKLLDVQQRFDPLRQSLVQRLTDLDAYERRLLTVSQEMLDEVLSLRMRPFRDGVHVFPRMVRDLARSLGKRARLEIVGQDTLVDRDILARMEAPLNQLLRNAIDHGIEPPAERLAAGKPEEALIRLEARHAAGMLTIQLADDGRGVNLDAIRRKIVERKMVTVEMAASLTTAELLEFLFLPAFSLKDSAGAVSGRGVGLDVVNATIRRLNGTARLETESGKGFGTFITLPLSQSVVRAVVVDVAGEAYAIPIAKIERILHLPLAALHVVEHRQFFTLENEHVGLVSAAQLLELGESVLQGDTVPLVLVGADRRHALIVDRIVGELSLAAQPLEGMFGKVKNIASAALLDDGTPVLILDVADVLVSIDKLSREGGLQGVPERNVSAQSAARRILVVDDSLTVREMERKLLQARGYQVTVAVDGIDGWNAVRSGEFDLVITDIDMPRMDGIELVELIKKDHRLNKLPVMIVSYKDRQEDRARGLAAGADFYLTKGSFHDETLLEAVIDLIGEASA